MNAVTHLEKVIVGEVSAVTHLEKVIAGETSAVTYTEKVITGEAPPITHLQKVIAGEASPVTHLEYVWAGSTPEPTEHEYTGIVPYTFKANGESLIDWSIYGNTVQSATPTPQNPIMPNGTGERTRNLFDMSTVENGKGIAMDGSITNYVRRCSTVTPIDVSTYDNVTLSFTATLSRTRVIYALFNDSTLLTRQTAIFSGTTIDVSSGNKLYICFYDTADTETIQKSDLSNVMLNTGSTALPYEPYGYKLDILSGDTTTPVYIGEVESTRRIKKYEFTGSETWSAGTENYYSFIPQTYGDGVPYSAIICSHCSNATINNTGEAVYFKKTDFPDITTGEELKQYCSDQYAAGTPVTVWYVLAEPETGIINEPLMKIGDYADEVSNVATIPTNNGSTTIDVDTAVKPSEVYIKYKGV